MGPRSQFAEDLSSRAGTLDQRGRRAAYENEGPHGPRGSSKRDWTETGIALGLTALWSLYALVAALLVFAK